MVQTPSLLALPTLCSSPEPLLLSKSDRDLPSPREKQAPLGASFLAQGSVHTGSGYMAQHKSDASISHEYRQVKTNPHHHQSLCPHQPSRHRQLWPDSLSWEVSSSPPSLNVNHRQENWAHKRNLVWWCDLESDGSIQPSKGPLIWWQIYPVLRCHCQPFMNQRADFTIARSLFWSGRALFTLITILPEIWLILET